MRDRYAILDLNPQRGQPILVLTFHETPRVSLKAPEALRMLLEVDRTLGAEYTA